MLTFCGSDLELAIERVLVRRSSYVACVGRDVAEQTWLIVSVDDNPAHLAWMCAPISARALNSVLDGQSTMKAALCHSLTGTAELVVIDDGRVTPDRCVLGADIPEKLMSRADWRLPCGTSRSVRRTNDVDAGAPRQRALATV
jgi:hypothetical protein